MLTIHSSGWLTVPADLFVICQFRKEGTEMPRVKDLFNKSIKLISDGKYEDALEVLNDGLKIANKDKDRGPFLYNIAVCQVHLGQKDSAIESLEKAVIAQPWLVPRILKDKDFASLKNETAFIQLVQKNKRIYVRTKKWYVAWIAVGFIIGLVLSIIAGEPDPVWDASYLAGLFTVLAWVFGKIIEAIFAFKKGLKSK
jgi:tetratricopeptide (TPR) repeat protein